eukprot:TRINITY_DN59062_c0_g1_i1.p1 TRINITY_DN59062_c0_g1~~TRINITY_DN59062_c0_g1_i1.p1  ORF type:complete len:1235 (+),score=171.38 TRINITY_DN59062_c0_g1_i1:50-3754(+)
MALPLDLAQSLDGRFVEIVGAHEVVSPTGDVAGIEAAGQRGQVVGWAPNDSAKHVVRTFSGLVVHAAPNALRSFDVKPGETGGFDVAWPDEDSMYLGALGNDVIAHLVHKQFCVIQCFQAPEMRAGALEQAKKKGGWKRLIKELEVAYLGRDAQGKVAWLPEDRAHMDVQNELESCDRMLTKLAYALYPEAMNSLGFAVAGRSDGLMRMACRSRNEEEDLLRAREAISEPLIKSGRIEDHIEFVQTRKVGFLFMICGSARVTLHTQDGHDLPLTLESGRILVFRHDELSFTYDAGKESLGLQAWLLSAGLTVNISPVEGSLGQVDEAMGVESGPPLPINPYTGKTVSITSMDTMLAGNGIGADQFWAMLTVGTDGGRHLSSLRWDPDIYFEPDKDQSLGKYYSNHGGFVMEEYIMGFDADFFGFSNEQAALMDPVQRNTLEVGYTILSKAGYNRRSLMNKNIGVYIGNCGTDWMQIMLTPAGGKQLSADWLYATNAHITSTRLSFIMGLRGPISTSDTACSSSLVATGEAHNCLRATNPNQARVTTDTGKTDHAVVIGTNGLFGPGSWIGLCGPKMLSAKGRCFTFDGSADGFGRGEGTSGLFAELTQKEPADRIAVFCGTCINQDGRSASMTAPHGPSQQECIKASLREADVTPADIRMAELHGTGTALGDPIEVGALRGVMKNRDAPICKSSAKSNLSHAEANAGMAGLCKCILTLAYGTVAPNVHLHHLNPHMDTRGYPVIISDELCELGTNTGYAGVSSFGFGGTNARADIWARAKLGHNKVKAVDLDKLENVYVKCPKCLGDMEWKSACMVPSNPKESTGQGRARARCVRGEFDSYHVCSLCYTGSYSYGQPPSEDPLPRATAYIKGSWNGFEAEEMKSMDGKLSHQIRLGETRFERFYIALEQSDDYAIFPSHVCGTMETRVKGPCPHEEGYYFVIDGRDEEWPEGSLINIKAWTERRFNQRKVTWELQPEEGGPKEMPSFQHKYQISGSVTQMKLIPMKAVRGLRNVFEYTTRIGLQDHETFHFVRDHDRSQIIYPARHLTRTSGTPVRGPDAGGEGKLFAVSGRQGEKLLIRLEVSDGHVTVSASVPSLGTMTWHSIEGRQRRRFSVAGSWESPCQLMEQDPENPDRYVAHMTLGVRQEAEFQILIDEDVTRAFFPGAAQGISGGAMVMGPDDGPSENMFYAYGIPGTVFEVCLDFTETSWRRVTWAPLESLALTDGARRALEPPR